jgi:carbon-monoxide dehydrogenase large subunit
MPSEASEIRFAEDGGVTLMVGTHSTGQGHETGFSQIVHEVLGIPFDDIALVQGDTDAVPAGGGHGGSRSLMIGGSALLNAAEAVREKGRAAAAHVLDAAPGDIDFADGLYAVRGSNRRITLQELERALRDAPDLPDGMDNTLGASGAFERTRHSFPNGCHIAEVEIDPQTGLIELVGYTVVDDFGRIVNPLIAAGQVYGGSVQGIGQALLEQVVYDGETGQIFTGSLMDYALPRADTLPAMTVRFNENAPTNTSPLGVKGAGEAGATGAPAAIANAVLDALKDHGVRHLEMPFTPEKVWRAIAGK